MLDYFFLYISVHLSVRYPSISISSNISDLAFSFTHSSVCINPNKGGVGVILPPVGFPRTSHDIDLKLGPVTKPDKRSTETLKKLTMTSCQQIVTLLYLFWFTTNFWSSRSQIPEAWPINPIFSLIVVTFILQTLQT